MAVRTRTVAPEPGRKEECPMLMPQTLAPAGELPGNPALAVTSPTAGETWAVGSCHYVTWASAPFIRAVSLAFTPDNGATWHTICQDDGSETVASLPGGVNGVLWQVPPMVTARCQIRVSAAGHSMCAQSPPFTIVPSQAVSGYRWSEVTPQAAFAGRDGAGAVTFNGRMWLLGGWNPGDKEHFPHICNNEVWSSTDGRTWELALLRAPWEGRHTAGYAAFGGRLWVIGGDCNQGHYQHDAWSSPDGVNWTLETDDLSWCPRALHHTVVHQDRLWVMGGQTLPQFAPQVPHSVYYHDVWCSEDGTRWNRVCEHAPWEERGMIGGSAVLNGRIWLIGGGTYDTPQFPNRKFFSDVWSSEDGLTWRRHVQFAPWQPRQYHDVAVFDGRLWVMEGWDGNSNRNDVWYSADGVNWYELADTPWAPRHAASVFVHDGALWMVAGNNMFPDVWKLTRE